MPISGLSIKHHMKKDTLLSWLPIKMPTCNFRKNFKISTLLKQSDLKSADHVTILHPSSFK